MVIAVAARTVPVGLMNQRTGLWYIPLQLPDMAALFRFRFDIRAVLSPVLRQRIVPVFKPRAFGVVFRMVLQGTTTQMAAITVVRRGLCGTGTGQTTIPVGAIKDFAYILLFLTARQHAGVSRPGPGSVVRV